MPASEGLFWVLVALSAATSLLTAIAGAGGGAVLIAMLALMLPAHAIIPVHGVVQMGSNIGRSLLAWRHIHWPTVAWFVPFGLLGTLAGSLLLVQLPDAVLQLCIAAFLLYLSWGPKLPQIILGKVGLVVGGFVTGFLSLFVGASGPVVAAFIKSRFEQRLTTVATFAATMSMQHAPKALVFGLAGFVFKEWLALIAAMMAAGFIGTWVGLKWLKRLSNQHFNLIFRWVITALALRLLWVAFNSFIPALSGVTA